MLQRSAPKFAFLGRISVNPVAVVALLERDFAGLGKVVVVKEVILY